MPFCATCGSPAEGRFCAKCGSAVGSVASPAAGPTGPPGAPVGAAGLTDNVAAALCYSLGLITGILFLVLAPYNQKKNIRFHAFQSIFLHVAAIVVAIGLNIVFGILGRIMGFWLVLTLSPLLWLAFTVVWILMIVWAYQGKTVVVPVIGPLAQQQA
jgi:uncharacterized membrane protein